ncbi:MAG: XdhC family protein [Desulfatiglandaceae bacterium]
MNIYSEILELSKKGRSAAMATVIYKEGSSPRAEGAKCLIADGKVILGSVGGGLVEAEACNFAEKVISSARPMTLSFNLDGGKAGESGMLCGGEMKIFLEPVSPVKAAGLPLFEKLEDISSRRLDSVLVTVIDEDKWSPDAVAPKMLIERGGAVTGSLGPLSDVNHNGVFEDFLSSKSPEVRHVKDESGISTALFIEPVIRRHILYVFGGGHVSRAVAAVAGIVDFEVVVVDDRPEYSRAEAFPQASRVLCMPFDGVLDRLAVDESSYLLIATRGHMHDMEVLTQALRSDAGYIGMVGSSRKRNEISRRLVESGFTENDFERVYSPVGIDIGAETPEEIAVSITAQIIRVRADGFEA